MRPIGLTFALTLLAATASYAQATGPRWIADASGCQFWDPAPMADETVRWSGRCVGGYADGHGTLTWFSHGELYETDVADFAHGMLNGHGSLSFVSGQKFDGQFRNQMPNGFGTFRTNDGQIFSGRWTEGCFWDGKRRAQYNALNGCNISS